MFWAGTHPVAIHQLETRRSPGSGYGSLSAHPRSRPQSSRGAGEAIWSRQLNESRGLLCNHDAKQVNEKWICHPEKSKRLLYLWTRLRHSVNALLARHSLRIEMPTISTLALVSLSPSLPKCEALTHRTPKRDTGRDNTQFYTCVHTNK